ncbi:iron ABC transporter permease [Fulvivirgaceae bacterium BMA10]|uniref:Iron ABC transporter permease n=1 Tax=Splendidivirga corallicola TaxID=3051826 RepID=A0ABT8KX27_9BACT|nr:iron ABC transporter permease [Fulvivirgaceae bacterium BMA10]
MNLALTYKINKSKVILLSLGSLLLITFLVSLTIGAVPINFKDVVQMILGQIGLQSDAISSVQQTVLTNIRLPRLVQTVLVGGALGISGAALQGLFRNPLVEPSLIGVSGGAAVFVVIYIVFTNAFPSFITNISSAYTVPFFAFAGGLCATLLVFKLSSTGGRTNIAVLILTGVAINALTAAVIGLAIYYADDNQLRTFTFWTLGDLGGATWEKLKFASVMLITPSLALVYFNKKLNALALGEAEAFHLGVNVEQTKYSIILLSALAVGTAVSISGMIGFVGLIIPHMIRLLFGPNHDWLLPGSILGGAVLLLVSDIIARTIVVPSELPIGIVTALLGAPFFIWLLLSAKHKRMI